VTARLRAAFERCRREGRPALITYVIPGYPDDAGAEAMFGAMVAGGADLIEVGIPFSDPMADGATIQRVSFAALQAGTTPRACIEFAAKMRSAHPDTPIVFMTYLNPVLAYGLETFAADAAAAGADAAIIVDLPLEESDETRRLLGERELDLVYLATPATSEERLRLIGERASGFVYCVSLTGVTGARAELPVGLPEFLARVRRCTYVPLAVGFGMSRREHIVALAGVADGVVVASALFDRLEGTRREERTKAVLEFVEVLSGRRGPAS
jgi:tryptophan synthase alpha chain